MEKKKEPIDKAIYVAFLVIMALLFCDITVFFQKCYWHHDDSIVLETASISIMIGILEGIILFDLLEHHKPTILSTFDMVTVSMILLFTLFHATTYPESVSDICVLIALILFFFVIIHRVLIPILPSFKNRH